MESAESSASQKVKLKRSGHACTECRKVKSKCTGKPYCQRCKSLSLVCHFLPSRRGKGTSLSDRDEVMAVHPLSHLAFPSAQLTHDFRMEPEYPKSSAAVSSELGDAERSVLSNSRQVGPPSNVAESAHSAAHDTPVDSSLDESFQRVPEDLINPLGLLVQASIDLHATPSPKDNAVGHHPIASTSQLCPDSASLDSPSLAAPLFFRRRIAAPQHRRPSELILQNVVTSSEIQDLFDIYFANLDRHIPLLSKEMHTPEATKQHWPFLLSCICAVASRFYSKGRVGLHDKCMNIARQEGFNLLGLGVKSLDLIQGFLLLTKWNQPSEDHEEDMSYQMSGAAIRLATDLNLDKEISRNMAMATDGNHTEREWAHRRRELERAWLVLYVSDHSISVQMGKHRVISHDERFINQLQSWKSQAPVLKQDHSLASMVQLHQIVGRMVDSLRADSQLSALPQNSAAITRILISSYATHFENWSLVWLAPGASDMETRPEAFYYHYYRVLMYSFGVQRCSNAPDLALELSNYCIAAYADALALINVARNWHQNGWLRYALNPNFVTLSYVATFLLKFSSPLYATIIPQNDAHSAVMSVVDLLEGAAVDQQHAPALYGKFLRLLLRSKQGTTNGQSPKAQGEAELRLDLGPQAPEVPPNNPASLDYWVSRQGTPIPVEDQSIPMSFGESMFWDDMLLPGLNEPFISLTGNSLQLSGPDGNQWFLDSWNPQA